MRTLALSLIALFGLSTASVAACPMDSASSDQTIASNGSQNGSTPVPTRRDREG